MLEIITPSYLKSHLSLENGTKVQTLSYTDFEKIQTPYPQFQ